MTKEYQERTTKELLSAEDIEKRFPSTFASKPWKQSALNTFNVDVVFPTPRPVPSSSLKVSVRDGVNLDVNGNVVQGWKEVDRFGSDDEVRAYANSIRETKKNAVRDTSASRAAAGVVFNGIEVSTSPSAMAKLTGAMQRPLPTRKVVTKGGRTELPQAHFELLFNGVADYIQALIDHEFDLLDMLDKAGAVADGQPEVSGIELLSAINAIYIDEGWPSNVL